MFNRILHRVPKSASVWLIKKTAMKNNYNYKINFFLRNQNTSFGGYWAPPGGMLDHQDHDDVWEEVYPSFVERFQHYQDLKFRIC